MTTAVFEQSIQLSIKCTSLSSFYCRDKYKELTRRYFFSVLHTAARIIHCSQRSEANRINIARSVKEDPCFSQSKSPSLFSNPRLKTLYNSHFLWLHGSLFNPSFSHSLSVLMVEQLQPSSHRQAIRYRCLRGTSLTSSC